MWRWVFFTILQSGQGFGAETWEGESWRFTGHANAWGLMSLDTERGLLYVPTSTPSSDYWGGRQSQERTCSLNRWCVLMHAQAGGGTDWGGTAFDPETGILYVCTSEDRVVTAASRPGCPSINPQALLGQHADPAWRDQRWCRHRPLSGSREHRSGNEPELCLFARRHDGRKPRPVVVPV